MDSLPLVAESVHRFELVLLPLKPPALVYRGHKLASPGCCQQVGFRGTMFASSETITKENLKFQLLPLLQLMEWHTKLLEVVKHQGHAGSDSLGNTWE